MKLLIIYLDKAVWHVYYLNQREVGIMSIVTTKIKILLLVLLIGILLAGLCFGPEVFKYMGGPLIWPLMK